MKKANKKISLNTRILSVIMIVSLLLVNVTMISPAFADDQNSAPVEESGGLGVLDLGDVDTGEGEGEQSDATPPAGEQAPQNNTAGGYNIILNYVNRQNEVIKDSVTIPATTNFSNQYITTITHNGTEYANPTMTRSDGATSYSVTPANMTEDLIVTFSYARVLVTSELVTFEPLTAQVVSWPENPYGPQYTDYGWVQWSVKVSLSDDAIAEGITLNYISFNPGGTAMTNPPNSNYQGIPADSTEFVFTTISLQSGYPKPGDSHNVSANVRFNGTYASFSGTAVRPELELAEELAIVDVKLDENNMFTVTASPASETGVVGTIGGEELTFTMDEATGFWTATYDATAMFTGDDHNIKIDVTSDAGETVSETVRVLKVNFYTHDNHNTPAASRYMLSDDQVYNFLPTADEYTAQYGSTLLQGQKIAQGNDASGNLQYSWYYVADYVYTEAYPNTTPIASRDFYPVVISEVKFLGYPEVTFDGNSRPVYGDPMDTTLWTQFAGNANLYMLSGQLPGTHPNLDGFIWTGEDGNEYDSGEVALFDISEPTTFTYSKLAEPVPTDLARTVFSGDATAAYLAADIQEILGTTETINFAAGSTFNVVWANGQPAVNVGFSESDVAEQTLAFTVGDSTEAQTIQAKIYPRVVTINRINSHVSVQGSNVMIDFEDAMRYPDSYSFQFEAGANVSVLSGTELRNFYSHFYVYVAADEHKDSSQPILGNYTFTALESNPMFYSSPDFDVVYKGGTPLFQLKAENDMIHSTHVDISPEVFSNYHMHMNQGNLSVYAADNFEDSKRYDGVGYTMDTEANDSAETDMFLEAVYGDIAVVENALAENQRLIVRFPGDFATNDINFDQTSYTTPAAPGVYEVPFKIFVAEFNSETNSWEPIAGETASVYSEDNAYTATITITRGTTVPSPGPSDPVQPTPTLTPTPSTEIPDPSTPLDPGETPPVTTGTPTPTAPVQITDAPPPLVALPSDTPTPAEPTDPVEIPEPSTPLAGGEETPEVTITEPETPLAAGNGAAWALVNLILTVFTGILSVVLLIGYFRNKREDEEYEDEDVKRKGAMRLFSIAPAVAAVVVFILTEDMSLPMTMVDQWTILMAIIALVQCGVTYMSRKEREEESENA